MLQATASNNKFARAYLATYIVRVKLWGKGA